MSDVGRLRLVLMDGHLMGGRHGGGSALVAVRKDSVREVALADAAPAPKSVPPIREAHFARFCVIGAFGFLVDAGALFALIERFEYSPLTARVISILIAVTATWLLHRRFTFRSTDPRRFAEWLRFAVVNGAGAGINFAVYALVLLALPGTPAMLALVMGSGVALLANYLGSRLYAFRSTLVPHA